jgi:N-methylhydantoinase B/oxoprolinase/acetone carboxylase alpha subunit
MRAGKTQTDIMRIILANVRTPVEREGDLLAQLMSHKRGEERLRELAARYGMPRVRRNSKALLDYTERLTRAMLRGIPNGEYQFEDFLDDDGITTTPVRIAVTIRKKGERAEVDFTGSSPQAAGPVNANYAIAVSATMYCFRCLMDAQAPYNDGLLHPIKVIAPAHSVVNADPPAAMAAGNVETAQRITDTVLGALAQAVPGRIAAASTGTMSNVSFGGYDTLRHRPFAWYETIAGGMGANIAAPGRSAVHTHMTNSWNTPIEAFEQDYPLRIRTYKVRPNSGGAGKYKGGDSIIRELEFLEPAEVTLLADRRTRGPYGLEGGQPGAPGRAFHNGKELPGKIRFEVKSNDLLRIETPAGGGYGKPE